MAVHDEEIKTCEYCGEELIDDHQVFCTLPYRDSADCECSCVCNSCRDCFLGEELPQTS